MSKMKPRSETIEFQKVVYVLESFADFTEQAMSLWPSLRDQFLQVVGAGEITELFDVGI